MQKSVIGYRATGARIGLVHFMTELAETALAAGDYGLGLATIEEAREICAKTGNRYHAADTHRVQGELLIGANRAEEGELRLLHSLNVARSQGARSLELRTLISLARRSPDWLIQLRATRDAFTEGLDTLDLRRADEVLARAEAIKQTTSPVIRGRPGGAGTSRGAGKFQISRFINLPCGPPPPYPPP